ncbi:O-antigen ligase family protein [Candidatus Entotheonella palauensis]|uniref:O-antigen ligase family protein n=1 Tax=Candidatus Entotheonella palauensis TaxID=93172 RepID=UPI0015C457D5|nr:O-antigen ligase family protein [Candidatus Entotheonella palauensis]
MNANVHVNPAAIGATGSRRTRPISTRYQWMLELLLYAYFLFSAFSHLWFYVPALSPVLFVNIALLVAVYDPMRLRWCLLPFLGVLSMLIIDVTGYELDVSTIKDYMFWIVMFAVFLVLHRDPRFFERAKIFFVILLGLHLFFLERDSGGRFMLNEEAQLGVWNANDLAYACGFAVFVSILAFTRMRSWYRFVFLIAAFGMAMVFLGTGSRGALLALMAAGLTYLILTFWQQRMVVMLLVISTCFAVGTWLFQDYFVDTLELYQERLAEVEESDYRISDRAPLMLTAIHVFFQSPWLGTGQNIVTPREVQPNTPHNTFLILAVHYGFLPVVLFLTLWCVLGWKLLALHLQRNTLSLGDLPYELVSFTLFLWIMTNLSNGLMLSSFSTLYMTKILTCYNDAQSGSITKTLARYYGTPPRDSSTA